MSRRLHIRKIRAQSGNTALILASEWGYIDCVQQLLDAGADTDAENDVRASVSLRLLL